MENLRDGSRGRPSSSNDGVHNFSTLPCFNLKWGRRKQLVCVKGRSPEHGSPSRVTHSEFNNSEHRKRRRSPSSDGSDGGDDGDGTDKSGIEVVREKLMVDLRNEANQMQATFFNGGKNTTVTDAVVGEVRPWNLRTRRAVCKDPNSAPNPNNNTGVSEVKFTGSPRKHVKLIGDGDRGEDSKPRAKFAVSLSKKEIEEDFLAMTGCRPARRPKKRAKHVQRQVDAISPGFWLSEITADMYKVNEPVPDGAKR